MKLILLPRWIEKAIVTKGQEPSRVVEDLEALSAILSPDDVAFYVYLNGDREQFLDPAIDKAFERFPLGLRDLDALGSRQYADYYESYVGGRLPDPQTIWFGEVHGVDRLEGGVTQSPGLKAEMLSYDTVAIRPSQRTLDEALLNDNMQALKSRLLSLIYSRNSFEALAKTELFSSWLGGMRHSE